VLSKEGFLRWLKTRANRLGSILSINRERERSPDEVDLIQQQEEVGEKALEGEWNLSQ
jgi:hypothetical protein